VYLGDIAAISSGITLGNEYSGSDAVEVAYLRVANVQDGYLDLSEVKTVKIPPSHVSKYLLEDGDVLMNEGGDFDKLGRGTIWGGEVEDCCHQNHVFKVRAHRSKLFPEYLAYWSASSFGKSYFIMNSKQSTNLASINSSQLKKFPVLVQSLDEQEKILGKLMAIDGNISKLELDIDKNKRIKKGLMQDLLTGKIKIN
jgi:type I restriction enzyme S subunit